MQLGACSYCNIPAIGVHHASLGLGDHSDVAQLPRPKSPTTAGHCRDGVSLAAGLSTPAGHGAPLWMGPG